MKNFLASCQPNHPLRDSLIVHYYWSHQQPNRYMGLHFTQTDIQMDFASVKWLNDHRKSELASCCQESKIIVMSEIKFISNSCNKSYFTLTRALCFLAAGCGFCDIFGNWTNFLIQHYFPNKMKCTYMINWKPEVLYIVVSFALALAPFLSLFWRRI